MSLQSVDEAGRGTQPVINDGLAVTRRRPDVLAVWLAGCVGLAALVYAWFEQYFVDPEVTLLPWLMRQGWPLYKDLIDQHPPLLTSLLTLLDGDPGLPIRIFIVLLRAITLLLTYLVARRLAGAWGGLIALAAAALWALGAEGAHLWYDGVLAPVYLGVLLLLAGFSSRVNAALSLGLLLGIGILTKQHAVLVVPGVALALWLGTARSGRGRRLLAFAAGLMLPLLLAVCYFLWQGTWTEMAYWVIGYTIDSGYAASSALAPASGEWPWLAAALAPAVALLLAWLAYRPRSSWRANSMLLLAGPWLLLAAILPVWPRYGRFHLQAAVPLLAVAAGVSVVLAIRSLQRPMDGFRVAAIVAAMLIAAYALVGAREAIDSIRIQATLGPVAAPYAATVPPLAAWVDAHTEQGAPIVLYGVDSILYRVLEHPPPRPWAPLLPWIMSAHNTYGRVWAGVVSARPQVAIVASSWWYGTVYPSTGPSPEWLRTMYHPAASFDLSPYSGAPLVRVVALQLDSQSP